MGPESERLQSVRIATNGSLTVESEHAAQELRLLDVGIGGFRVQSSMLMPVNAIRTYRFSTPDRLWSAVFRARTVYCNPDVQEGRPTGQFVSGFCFVLDDQPPSVRQQIASMVKLVTSLVPFS
jgi:hypothetical protein